MSGSADRLVFAVAGEPQPQGSVSAWVPTDRRGEPYRRQPSPRNPRGAIIVNVTTDNADLKAWREAVAAAAGTAMRAAGWERDDHGGFCVEVVSFLRSPQDRYGTGRNAATLKPGAAAYPLTKPDVDKLVRAVLDALTGLVWRDDSQVTDTTSRKRYAVPESLADDGVRAYVEVTRNLVRRGEHLDAARRTRWVSPPPGQGTLV